MQLSCDPMACIGTNAVKYEAPSAPAMIGGTKRRKVRKLVNKMYIDEDGSMGWNMLYYAYVNCCHSYRERMAGSFNRR